MAGDYIILDYIILDVFIILPALLPSCIHCPYALGTTGRRKEELSVKPWFSCRSSRQPQRGAKSCHDAAVPSANPTCLLFSHGL